MNTAKLEKWDIHEQLKSHNDADIAYYISVAAEENDPDYFIQAIKNAAIARGIIPRDQKD